MNSDAIIKTLATITLIQMMVTIGLGVSVGSVAAVAKNAGLVARAAVANYVIVPAAAVGLLLAVGAHPLAAAGIMMAAVCPGAPYGPPFTALAKGDVIAAVGLMVVLSGSSAIVAPVLLRAALPIVASGEAIQVDALKLVVILGLSQLLPLGAGLWLRAGRPHFSDRLAGPFKRLSALLNLALIVTILVVNFRTLAEVRFTAYSGMVLLIGVSAAAGWLLGGRRAADRKTMAITTSMRNVGVSLVIATSSLPGTAAVTAATAYALVQTFAVAIGALASGRLSPRPDAVGASPAGRRAPGAATGARSGT
jgi:BASS family bile acid:Na+ symporter